MQPSFADYIESCKEKILDNWKQRVDHDDRIQSSDMVDTEALLDHLPEILTDFCIFLRQHQNLKPHEVLKNHAAIHGIQRWMHGYSLKDVLLEIEKLRKLIMIDLMRQYINSQPSLSEETQQRIERLGYDFFQELIVGSTIQYTKIKENEISDYNKRLTKKNSQLNQLNVELQVREAEVLRLSLTDPLTQIANRRHIEKQLQTEIKRAQRYNRSLIIVMLDLDHFKTINDRYGHEVGDTVLKSVAYCIKTHIRAIDFIARYGGEEFILLLPDTLISSAQKTVSRIRQSISELKINPIKEPVTASFGMVQWKNGESMSESITRADNAMYRAKTAGRNCVKLDTEK